MIKKIIKLWKNSYWKKKYFKCGVSRGELWECKFNGNSQ